LCWEGIRLSSPAPSTPTTANERLADKEERLGIEDEGVLAGEREEEGNEKPDAK
jgi:hypothetical protein